MGCDIHGYIESKPNPKHHPDYWRTDADLHLERNYAMFGLLAGVRGEDAPLVPPRGFDDASSLKFEFCLYVNDNLADKDGYTTKEHADRHVSYGYSRWIGENMITHPDWHSASWLTADEFEKVLAAYDEKYTSENWRRNKLWSGVLAMLKSIPNSRFVFWFDN